MTEHQSLLTLVDALNAAADVVLVPGTKPLGNAVFVGSGDSLSSAMIATRFGHRAMSSGDITWADALPASCDTLVGISHSGTSGATVRALHLAQRSGMRTIAITSNPDSPLAEAADEVQPVPSLQLAEVIPCAGHLMLGLGVASLSGVHTEGATRDLARILEMSMQIIAGAVEALPSEAPSGISVLTLPDMRSAGDFWMLKLIEACGLPVRSVALEESGHVDYFIGPQPYLALSLVGRQGMARHSRLAEALASTGQRTQQVAVLSPSGDIRSEVLADLAAAAIGTFTAEGAAARWGRPPFRGGAVNMDARHIKLDEQPIG
ncbi:SIS domain-containing protein [Arthrobacter sp. efr-133-R2A-120]|uniref:SIS domain-containing protein n=1 Tax=Arthrobacter sp. efr-133-R2A-120 TaxID=3040277 RepID=UPI00254B0746|nr:SIS domain-containing protein [Arthrobacter sp. efr-133-R2A-120]